MSGRVAYGLAPLEGGVWVAAMVSGTCFCCSRVIRAAARARAPLRLRGSAVVSATAGVTTRFLSVSVLVFFRQS